MEIPETGISIFYGIGLNAVYIFYICTLKLHNLLSGQHTHGRQRTKYKY